jgi:hypothetical protein
MSVLYVLSSIRRVIARHLKQLQNTYSTALVIGEKAALIIARELGIGGV